MDNIYVLKQNGGHSKLCRLLLLLLLAGLQPVSPDDGTLEPGPNFSCTIVSPDYVTVGVPSSIECKADCYLCTYSMSLVGHSANGQDRELTFTLTSWEETVTATCTVTDDNTQLTATTTKQLRVLAGPANVSISGPDLMNPTVSHTYSCQAYCRPSCTYAWSVDKDPWISGQGNVISITPQEEDTSKVLICKAINSVSGLFVTTTRNIAVPVGPKDIQIKGPDVINMFEKEKFVCTSECWPSCRYVTSVNSKTLKGSEVELMVEHSLESVTVKCEAQNTASRKRATASKTVHITGSVHNLSTRPEETSAVMLLLVFITSAAVTL